MPVQDILISLGTWLNKSVLYFVGMKFQSKSIGKCSAWLLRLELRTCSSPVLGKQHSASLQASCACVHVCADGCVKIISKMKNQPLMGYATIQGAFLGVQVSKLIPWVDDVISVYHEVTCIMTSFTVRYFGFQSTYFIGQSSCFLGPKLWF